MPSVKIKLAKSLLTAAAGFKKPSGSVDRTPTQHRFDSDPGEEKAFEYLEITLNERGEGGSIKPLARQDANDAYPVYALEYTGADYSQVKITYDDEQQEVMSDITLPSHMFFSNFKKYTEAAATPSGGLSSRPADRGPPPAKDRKSASSAPPKKPEPEEAKLAEIPIEDLSDEQERAVKLLQELENGYAESFDPKSDKFSGILSKDKDCIDVVANLLENKSPIISDEKTIQRHLKRLITSPELIKDPPFVRIKTQLEEIHNRYAKIRLAQIKEVVKHLPNDLVNHFPDKMEGSIREFFSQQAHIRYISSLLAFPASPQKIIEALYDAITNTEPKEGSINLLQRGGEDFFRVAQKLGEACLAAEKQDQEFTDRYIAALKMPTARKFIPLLHGKRDIDLTAPDLTQAIKELEAAHAIRGEAKHYNIGRLKSRNKKELNSLLARTDHLEENIAQLQKIKEDDDKETQRMLGKLQASNKHIKDTYLDKKSDENVDEDKEINKALENLYDARVLLELIEDERGAHIIRLTPSREALKKEIRTLETTITELRKKLSKESKSITDGLHKKPITEPEARMIVKSLRIADNPEQETKLVASLAGYFEFTSEGLEKWQKREGIPLNDDPKKRPPAFNKGENEDHAEWLQRIKQEAFKLQPFAPVLPEDLKKTLGESAAPSPYNLPVRAMQRIMGLDKVREKYATLYAAEQLIQLHAQVKQPLALQNSSKGLAEYNKISESIRQLQQLRDQLRKRRRMNVHEANMLINILISRLIKAEPPLAEKHRNPKNIVWNEVRNNFLKHSFTAEGLKAALAGGIGTETYGIIPADHLENIYQQALLHENNPTKFEMEIFKLAGGMNPVQEEHPALTEEERCILQLETNINLLEENYRAISACPKPVPVTGTLHFADKAKVELDEEKAKVLELKEDDLLDARLKKDYIQFNAKNEDDAKSLARWEKLASNSESFSAPKSIELDMSGARRTDGGKLIIDPQKGERITRVYPPIPNPTNSSFKETTVEKDNKATSWELQVLAFGGEANSHAILKAFLKDKLSIPEDQLAKVLEASKKLPAVPTKEDLVNFLSQCHPNPNDLADQYFGKKRPYRSDIPSFREQYSMQEVAYRNKSGSLKSAKIPSDTIFIEAKRMLDFAHKRSEETGISPVVIQHVANPAVSIALDILIQSDPVLADYIRLKVGMPKATEEQRVAATSPSILMRAHLSDPLEVDTARLERFNFEKVVLRETGVSMRAAAEGQEAGLASSDSIHKAGERVIRGMKKI